MIVAVGRDAGAGEARGHRIDTLAGIGDDHDSDPCPARQKQRLHHTRKRRGAVMQHAIGVDEPGAVAVRDLPDTGDADRAPAIAQTILRLRAAWIWVPSCRRMPVSSRLLKAMRQLSMRRAMSRSAAAWAGCPARLFSSAGS